MISETAPGAGQPRQHAFSLLVHECPEVVVDQCRNFETFAPASLIMIHVSAAAPFSRESLEGALAGAGCTRSLVNPVSVPSRWGNVIAGHLANIRALTQHCSADASVAMNASNDLLLAPLPAGEGAAGPRYEAREVRADGLWYTGRQFARSAAFASLMGKLGCRRARGSQIEGTSYPLALLADLAERLAREDALLAGLPMIAEEIVFPTFAHDRLGPAPLRPFVLFRPDLLTGLAARAVPRLLRGGAVPDLAQKAANRLTARWTSPDARPADIEAIIAGRPLAVAGWPHGAPDEGPRVYHGIKRIPRRLDHPLRARIRAATQAQAARTQAA